MITNKHCALIVPQTTPTYANLISDELEKHGITVNSYSWRDIDTKDIFNIDNNPTVIIADAENCPAFMQNLVSNYLKTGGNVVTLGGPPFSNEFYSINNNEVDIFTLKNMMCQGEFDKTVIMPLDTPNDLEGFVKDTYNPDSKKYEGNATLSIADDGVISSRCLKYYTDDFSINESFEKNITINEKHNVIGFYAKALQNTRTITLKLIQDNGDMFKTTFCPTTNFSYYIFTKRDFVYAGNQFNLVHECTPIYVDYSKVSKIQFGHALSHAYSVAGEHAFFIQELSSANISLLNDTKVSIDGLYPHYKFFPVTNAVSIKSYEKQSFIDPCSLRVPVDLFSHSPRSQATGINKGRRSRFIPLLECHDEKGLQCGYAAYMILPVSIGDLQSTNKTGSIIAFTTADYSFYQEGGAVACAQAIASLYNPAILIEGGTDEYIYQTNDTANIGAVVLIREQCDELKLKINYNNTSLIYDITDLNAVQNSDKLNILRVVTDFIPTDTEIVIELLLGDRVIDILSHSVSIFKPKPEDELQFAYIKPNENEIYIGDKCVRFFGVNYMPSSGLGMDTYEEFEHYVAGYAYDPDIIENDLKRICDVGLNAVSIFMSYEPSINSNNILHLVDLCAKYSLYVDFSIRPHANPFDFSEDEVRRIIKKYNFDKNDTIVAYDIAWERYVGTYNECYGNFNGRKSFDKDWARFVLNRYGSIEAAQHAWGRELPTNSVGEIIGLSDDMLREKDANKMVAAYRRFIDNLVATAHHKAMQFIKSIDPNHLISPRTGDASTIPLVDPGIYGYDYKALSSSMDFMSPESYALSDNYKSLRQGVFTNIYARYANPDNVIQWKEFGKSIWTGSNFSNNSISEEFQAEYYRRFIDMLILGHTNGLYAWWWAGGYRIGENSDFGIIAPDGSDRPVTRVLREYADKFLGAPPLKRNAYKILVNRDLHADGLLSMYQSIEHELFSKLESGFAVEFIDGGSGMTSANVELTEIGNDTPKGYISMYLDYIITDITAEYPSELPVSLVNYDSVKMGSTIKITLLNTEKPTWISKGYGSVSLVSTDGTVDVPMEYNVKSLSSYTFSVKANKKGELNLLLQATDRTAFGERIILTVE